MGHRQQGNLAAVHAGFQRGIGAPWNGVRDGSLTSCRCAAEPEATSVTNGWLANEHHAAPPADDGLFSDASVAMPP
jgi:hypothetical protein